MIWKIIHVWSTNAAGRHALNFNFSLWALVELMHDIFVKKCIKIKMTDWQEHFQRQEQKSSTLNSICICSICLSHSFQLISMLHCRLTLLYYLGYYYISQRCHERMVLSMGPQSFSSQLFSLISSWLWVMFILIIVCHLYLAVFYQRNTHPDVSATGTDKNQHTQTDGKKCEKTNKLIIW